MARIIGMVLIAAVVVMMLVQVGGGGDTLIVVGMGLLVGWFLLKRFKRG